LRQIISGIGNLHLRALLDAFMDDEAIARRYRTAPAAKNVHHAYLGGLIEHVLSLCTLCRATAAHYRHVDLDLMLAGAVLHDIGKISELTYDRSFGYSTEGQLLGHIVIGLRMIQEKIARFPDFPPRLRTLVEHMIASHHGELEFGSPKVPLFPEALLLHHLDNLDSKMECMRNMVAKDRHVEGCWTGYSSALDRSVLKKAKYLEEFAENATVQEIEVVEAITSQVAEHEAPMAQGPDVLASPAPAPKGEPSNQQSRSLSLFGEKLQQVWRQNS
jgi:3'-5' exoribonuclease